MHTSLILLWASLSALAATARAEPPPFTLPAATTLREDFELRTRVRRFTTPAYEKAALAVLLHEANDVAARLELPEKLPIELGDVTAAVIAPPGSSDQEGLFGTIETTNYIYSASKANKLCLIDWNRKASEPFFEALEKRYSVPDSQNNTNAAYRLATKWLGAAGIDMQALDRDCVVRFHVMQRGSKLLPVYWVMWRQPAASMDGPVSANDDGLQTQAAVWLVEPDRRLLQMSVDPRYILRKPVAVENRDQLLQESNDPLMRQMKFTTSAYKEAAIQAALHEANLVARELDLAEKLPIERSDIKNATVSPPYASDRFGWFATLHIGDYCFSAAASNKLSWVERDLSDSEERFYLAQLKSTRTLPKSELNTNAALTTARGWLSALAVDIGALERDFAPCVRVWELGNSFVPLYEIDWARVEDGVRILAAEVALVEPGDTLKRLVVYQPEYLSRQPLRVPDREDLLGTPKLK
jgi:hypothetical protein